MGKIHILAKKKVVPSVFHLHPCFPPENDIQSITEEPKYQAKALIVVMDTIKKLINSGDSCSGNYS